MFKCVQGHHYVPQLEGREVAGDEQGCCLEALPRLLLSAGWCPGEWLQSPQRQSFLLNCQTFLHEATPSFLALITRLPGLPFMHCNEAILLMCFPAGLQMGLVCFVQFLTNQSQLQTLKRNWEILVKNLEFWHLLESQKSGSYGPMLHDSTQRGTEENYLLQSSSSPTCPTEHQSFNHCIRCK